ncbi:hypothetical protein NKI89_26600 [Mesorhizobium sp. M0309]|uniref:hypothetical protein n=1 Tax=Mesorhizobium sp. M0309 TaxID=2956933 RepID=UPI003337264F
MADLTDAAELLDSIWIISPGCSRSCWWTGSAGFISVSRDSQHSLRTRLTVAGETPTSWATPQRHDALVDDAAVACGIWAGREERLARPARPSSLALDAARRDLGRYRTRAVMHRTDTYAAVGAIVETPWSRLGKGC